MWNLIDRILKRKNLTNLLPSIQTVSFALINNGRPNERVPCGRKPGLYGNSSPDVLIVSKFESVSGRYSLVVIQISGLRRGSIPVCVNQIH